MKNDALVLLSGGLDSAVTAWIADRECNKIYAMTIDYGQSHKREVSSALQLGLKLGVVQHKVVNFDLSQIVGSSSSLFDKKNIPVEGTKEGIPSTWVPQRNAIFLALAFSWAEVVGVGNIYMGVNSVDYSGYPDCRPEFIKAISPALNLASKRFVENHEEVAVVTPIIGKTKKEIVELGLKLGVPFSMTTSCYKGGSKACGVCDSCRIRLAAFQSLNQKDPIEYEEAVMEDKPVL